jgi:hypothetical protein
MFRTPISEEPAAIVAGLGYPGFAGLRSRHWTPKNPGEVLLTALAQDDLESRLVEALPWLVLRYSTLDWTWVVREAKVRDLQNCLGFVVGLARQLAVRGGDERKARSLADLDAHLESQSAGSRRYVVPDIAARTRAPLAR